MRGDTLPDNHRHHGDCSDENADSKNHPPWALALAPSSRTHDEKLITVVNRLLPVGCVFLAAICALLTHRRDHGGRRVELRQNVQNLQNSGLLFGSFC